MATTASRDDASNSNSNSNSSSSQPQAKIVTPALQQNKRSVRARANVVRDRCAALYTTYVLKLILRQKALPPSKDGRHVPLQASHHKHLVDERRGAAYISNSIRSSRYTIWDFLPKQFFFQATRLNNVYFIAIGIPQAIPGISTTGNYTTILPLLFFICLTVAKEGYDDYRRHRLDTVENNSFATVLRSKNRTTLAESYLKKLKSALTALSRPLRKKKHEQQDIVEEVEIDTDDVYEWAKVQWHDINVGDIVRLKRNDAVPADLALLFATGENGVAYVETAALDGESNLKSKQAPHDFENCGTIGGIKTAQAEFVLEDPNRDLYDFNGRANIDGGETSIPLTVNEVVYRGSVLRNTERAIGMVINTGEECKIRMNANHHPKAKKPRLERHSNHIVLTLIAYVVILAVGSAAGYAIWHREYEVGAWYLSNSLYNVYVSFRDIFLGFLIMYNNVIPLAMYVSLEIVKIGQMLMVQSDVEMYDPVSNTPMTCNTNTILENLGQVSYVLSDKTGTLTENVMNFRKMSIAGFAITHRFDSHDLGDHKNDSKTVLPERPSQNVAVVSPTRSTFELRRRSIYSLPSPRFSTAARTRPSFSGSILNTAPREITSGALIEHIRQRPDSAFSRNALDFILGLALCHTALPENNADGEVEFEASSPDEVALVRAAHELGYTLKARSSRNIILTHTGPEGESTEQSYEVLDVIEFSSHRKRMSIILRCPNGEIWMLCKGADTVIVPRLHHSSLATRKSLDMRRSRQLEREAIRKSEQVDPRASFNARISFALSARPSLEVPASPARFEKGYRPSLEVPPSPGRLERAYRPSVDGPQTPYKPIDEVLHSPIAASFDDAGATDESLVFTRCFRHLDDFATEGLRTLLYAQKKIPEQEYEAWKQQYQEATTSLTDRQEKIEETAEQIEHDLELLGASAIEDKLQEGVPETIEKLRRAAMKIWMLTGDKRETAINIAHSAGICQPLSDLHILDVSKGDIGGQIEELAQHIREEPHHIVAVIDGQTLAAVEENADLKQMFDPVILQMDSVICCRASPHQKADIVRSIRAHIPNALTLAIGDGSNDIAMIQASHVGVGVSGKEGLQAARVADYSIAQFRFLQRLLLVHGRWNYIRTAKFILWTFFKEFFFYMMQALYQRYDGYTGSSLYESWSLTVLNTLFTSLCVIVPGILEQDLRAETLLAVPELYTYGPRNQGLNLVKFLRWMTLAAAEGLMVWFVTWAAWGHFNYSSDNGAFALGDLCFSLGIAWQNIKLLLLETHNQTMIVYGAFGITFGGWWAWNAFLAGVYTSNLSPFDVRHGFTQGFGMDVNWWATFTLVLVLLVVFEVAMKAGKRYLRAMRVAQAWRKGAQQTMEDPWASNKESVLPSDKSNKTLSFRAWLLLPWTEWSRRNRMPSQWDLGVWQEIEAEQGVREQLQAAADGPRHSIEEEDGHERTI